MKKRKVMIVDDEKDFLAIVKLNLEETGKYEVQVISEAADIVSRVKSFNPDIILLDILMPKIDGFKACKMLKDDPATNCVPVMIISALDTEKDKSTMYGLGVVDYLVKPLGKEALIAKIENALKDK